MKIEIKDLSYKYHKTEVLSNVNVEIDSGDFLAVVGHNGSGKTTLMKILLGQLKVSKGCVLLDEQDVNVFNKQDKIGYVSQRFDDFSFNYPISVEELLKTSMNKNLSTVIEMMQLEKFRKMNFNSLSGGQQQRVFIARALLHSPSLLILDEPFVGVDQENIDIIYNVLAEINKNGTTIVIVTHQKHKIKKYVNKVLVLNNAVFYYGDSASYDDRMCEEC